MNNLAKITLTILATCPMLLGQDTTQGAKPTSTETAVSNGVVSKLFILRYVDSNEMEGVVRGLMGKDGSVASRIVGSRNTLSVSAPPENMLAIEAAIAVLDVRQPSALPAITAELRISVLWAGNDPNILGGDPVPSHLSGATSAISGTLGYKQFRLGGVFTQLVSSNTTSATGGGKMLEVKSNIPLNDFSWIMNNCRLSGDKDNAVLSGIFGVNYHRQSVISGAAINLKYGEKNVIGSTTVGNGIAMIILVSLEKPTDNI